eukprot:Partr_v1_DN26194_c0_g1_i1_m10330 putative Serine palmitoyl-transferase
MSNHDYLGLTNNRDIVQSAVDSLRKHGVGACGPPGFYGTLDAHLELEAELARFIGTEEAIIYAQAFSALSSVIPAFAKRGEILICDENINFGLQKGVQISRTNVKYFKHNDMEDLERILKEVTSDIKKSGKPLTRRFIVFEGLYQNSGEICPLPEILELKHKYKFRLIADETHSFGVLGSRGAGVTDHYGIDPKSVDIIVSSMANSLGAGGGFCAGSHEVIDHQRLSGVAYCFSAALPAMIAKSATEGLLNIERNPQLLSKLRSNIRTFRKHLGASDNLFVSGFEESPVMHLRLKHFFNSRESEDDLLQQVVDRVKSSRILTSRAKYVVSQENNVPKPSIRVTISVLHTESELKKAGIAFKKAFDSLKL